MALGDVEEIFISGTCNGTFFPFMTVREVSRKVKDDPSNVNRYIKVLVECGVLKEYPFNDRVRTKRYQVSKEYYFDVYSVSPWGVMQRSEIKEIDSLTGVK